MERRQEERRKALEQEASFVKAKGRFFGVEFSDGEICIRVLDSVEAIRQEGEAMHHCVFKLRRRIFWGSGLSKANLSQRHRIVDSGCRYWKELSHQFCADDIRRRNGRRRGFDYVHAGDFRRELLADIGRAADCNKQRSCVPRESLSLSKTDAGIFCCKLSSSFCTLPVRPGKILYLLRRRIVGKAPNGTS